MSSIYGRFISNGREKKGKIQFNPENGLIESIETIPDTNTIKFNDDCIIFPGFGDIHIHAREDVTGKNCYKEDFMTASEAAINGGVVHLGDMPNNPIPPVDDSTYSAKESLTFKAPIHITLYAGVGPNTNPLERDVPYKVFMGPSIGELFFRDTMSLEKTLERYKGCNVSFHCEDPDILEKNKEQEFHEDKRPVTAEISATETAIQMIEKFQLKGKLCHYSSGKGLDLIDHAKKRGVSVTCEVTPTHLFFDKSMLTNANRNWFQMNPPLRDKFDRETMMEALKSGVIDYLATDHAPHTIEEKIHGISGISQLDTYSLFVTWLILEKKVSLIRIYEVCSRNPGAFINPYRLAKFGKGFGEIAPGFSASFTILNLKKPCTFSRSMVKSKSGWSPFEGFTFPGSLEAVYFQGKTLR